MKNIFSLFLFQVLSVQTAHASLSPYRCEKVLGHEYIQGNNSLVVKLAAPVKTIEGKETDEIQVFGVTNKLKVRIVEERKNSYLCLSNLSIKRTKEYNTILSKANIKAVRFHRPMASKLEVLERDDLI